MRGTRTFDRLPSWRMANLHFEEWRGWQPGRVEGKRRFPGDTGKKISREGLFDCLFSSRIDRLFQIHRKTLLRLTARSRFSIPCNPCFHAPSFCEPSHNSPNPSSALPFRKPTSICTIPPSSLPSCEDAADHRPERVCATATGAPILAQHDNMIQRVLAHQKLRIMYRLYRTLLESNLLKHNSRKYNRN